MKTWNSKNGDTILVKDTNIAIRGHKCISCEKGAIIKNKKVYDTAQLGDELYVRQMEKRKIAIFPLYE